MEAGLSPLALSSPEESVVSREQWPIAAELLEAGQYELLSDLLDHWVKNALAREDSSLIGPLLSAQQLCQTCLAYDEMSRLHQQILETTQICQQTAQSELESLLAHVCLGTPEPVIDIGPKTKEKRPWIQQLRRQVQDLLGLTPEQAKKTVLINYQKEKIPHAPTAEITQPAARETPKRQLGAFCLGAFNVYYQDQKIEEWNGLKGQSILKYLLIVHKEQPVARDVLSEVFWPEMTPEAARRNLHQAIYSLRQALRKRDSTFKQILFENDAYLFNPELVIWVDCDEFEQRVKEGQRLDAIGHPDLAINEYSIAESLYQGPLFADDLYEEWIHPLRRRFKQLYLFTLDRLSQHYLQQKAYTVTLILCQKLLAEDNCHEVAYRRSMRCYAAQGQRHLAVRSFQRCSQKLKQELDLTPSAQTLALYEEIIA